MTAGLLIAAYRKAVALDPDFAAAQGDLDGAEENFQQALQTNPDLPEALGNLGHLQAARKRLDQAIYYFARTVQLKPNDAEVLINYSVTLAGLERFDEAERQIEAAIRSDPKTPEARNFMGRCWLARATPIGPPRISGGDPPVPRFCPGASERRPVAGRCRGSRPGRAAFP